jgi:hypothetical protein
MNNMKKENSMEITWKHVCEHNGSIIPCLVGPSGSGKTARVHEYAEETGKRLLIVLLGSMLEEDVLGLPKVDEKTTRWTVPDWAELAINEPCIVFLDELDKARQSVWGSVLTLIASRTIRGRKLHPDTRIVAAMQPVSPKVFLANETGLALAARMCFVPVNHDRQRLTRLLGVDLTDVRTGPMPEIPVLDILTDRQLEWAVNFARSHYSPDSEQSLIRILQGVVGDFAEELVERIKVDKKSLTPAAILKAAEDDLTLLEDLKVPELIGMLKFSYDVHPKVQAEMLKIIWENGSVDDRQAALSEIDSTLNSFLDRGITEVWSDIPDEEVDRIMADAIQRVVKNWKEVK